MPAGDLQVRVPVRRARLIDELSGIVAGHETVLTADAPLALALNRRLDGARLGDVAATPRNHVARGLDLPDRRELFHRVVRETSLDFKEAAAALELVLEAYEDTGRVDRALAHDRHDTPVVRAVVEIVADTDSAWTLREATTIPASEEIAVVGLDGFSALDRSILPDDASAFTTVDPFHPTERFELPPFELMASPVDIVDTLEAHLTPDNAGDVGIVLDPAGPLRPLVEATLDARSIPYHTEEELGEHPGMRALVRLLRLALSGQRLRGRDVRGLLVHLGHRAPVRHDERRLPQLDGPGARRLRGLLDALDGAPLSEAVSTVEAAVGGSLSELRELLDELDLAEAPVAPDVLNALELYLDTFPIERSHTRRGVLLASGRDNAYVDRPLVFYLGMGADWARRAPSHAWVDDALRQAREQRDRARFERLVQSGQEQVYLVQDARRGKPVTPCFHLHELVDEPFERFRELDSRRRRPPEREPTEPAGFEREPVDAEVEATPVETLSASALDRLTHCPRDHYMDELAPTRETDALERGRLIHAFARVYAAHPDAVDVEDEAAREALVDLMLETLEGLVDPDRLPVLATDLEVGLVNVARWLDANPPARKALAGYTEPPPNRREATNTFAEHLDVDLDPAYTERWFEAPEVGVHGKVDLLHGPARLVDWKTTRNPDSLTRTVRKARVGTDETPHTFQPSVYLLHHRHREPGTRLAFTFADVLANRADVLRGHAEPGDVERTVRYHPRPFREHVASREAFDFLCHTSAKREDVLGELGYPAYRDHVTTHELPDLTSKDGVDDNAFTDRLVDRAVEARGAPSTSESAVRGAMRKLVELRKRALFEDDLDALEAHVHEMLDHVREWRRSRFPVPDDADLDRVRHRSLILRELATHRAIRRRPGGGRDG